MFAWKTLIVILSEMREQMKYLSLACHGITGRTIFHAKLLRSPETENIQKNTPADFAAIR
ncbi:hypothetical protein [Gimesia sp.]|uniref:hypothetical protein n=1 Tax=Gimesia sp. TaxID=2024833 RepID=UPI003A8EB830